MTYNIFTRTSSTLAAVLLIVLWTVVGCTDNNEKTPVNTGDFATPAKICKEKLKVIETAQIEIRKQISKAARAYEEAKKMGASEKNLSFLKKNLEELQAKFKAEQAKAREAVRKRIKAETR